MTQANVKDSLDTEKSGGKKEIKDGIDYDELLSSAGEFGPYQFMLSALVSPFYVFGGFVYFSQMFLTEVSPNHWCWIPELENLTVSERRKLAIPPEDSSFGYSRCTSYVADWSEVLATGARPNTTWKIQDCQNGWEFNKTEFPYPTIASELGWVCERDSYQATAQSLFFFGSIFGGFLIGAMSDRFGRVPAIIFANFIGCVAGSCSVFAKNFLEFSVTRFFMGMAYDNCMMMVFLLILEYTVPKYRTIATNLVFAIFFTVGVTSLPWISLACGYWKTIALATSLPLGLTVFYYFVLPESSRWLLSKGRVDEVIDNVYKIAKMNKREIPSEQVFKFKISCANQSKEESGTIFELLKRPLLRQMLFLICVEFICCVIVFDALVRTIGSLKFDFFISFTLISFTELPSLILMSLIMDFTGRKWLVNISMSICAIFSFLIPFVGGGITSVSCAVVARFFVNMAFNGVMQWTAELMPTPVRGSASAAVHICGYVATVISPFIAYLDHYISWLSLVVVGSLATIAAVTSLFLPETAKRDMPHTFDDAVYLMKSRQLIDMPWLKRNPTVNSNNAHVNESFEIN